MPQLLFTLQPPPLRVMPIDDQGQFVESWQRFFLSSQAAIVQILAAKPAALVGTITMPLDDASGFVDDFAGISAPITGRISGGAFTQGSVIFAGSGGILSQDNAKFFWDDTNFLLGIGKNAPSAAIDIVAPANTFGINLLGNATVGQSYGLNIQAGTNTVDYGLRIQNQAGTQTFLQVFGTGSITGTAGRVGEIAWTVNNTLAGSANFVSFNLTTDSLANFQIFGYSSTFTPVSNFQAANGGALVNTGAGGLSFAQTGTGSIRFYTTASQLLRMTIASNGIVTLTAMLQVNGTARSNPLGVKASGTGFAQGFGVYDTTDDGFLEVMYNGTSFQIGATYQSVFGYKPIAFFTSQIERLRIGTTASGGGIMVGTTTDPGVGGLSLSGLVKTYNNVATAGGGVPAIYGSGRSTAQTGAVASVATYTVGAADGSFLVSMNILITAFTAGTISGVVTYTSEDGTARSLTLNFSAVTGALSTTAGAAGAFEGVPLHIRAKASTAITATTTVTVFTGTYNVEAYITQLG